MLLFRRANLMLELLILKSVLSENKNALHRSVSKVANLESLEEEFVTEDL
jgi:hypothetical protein